MSRVRILALIAVLALTLVPPPAHAHRASDGPEQRGPAPLAEILVLDRHVLVGPPHRRLRDGSRYMRLYDNYRLHTNAQQTASYQFLVGKPKITYMHNNTDVTISERDVSPGRFRDLFAPRRVLAITHLIKGEIFVVRTKGSNYLVTTNKTQMRLTSGAFDIRSYGKKSAVIVVKGKVQVHIKNHRKPVEVTKNQKLTVSPAQAVKVAIIPAQSQTKWTHSITPLAAPPTIQGSLPDGQAGVRYAQTLHAFGGTSPYTWAVDSGSLPPGLHLAADGSVSGVPTSSGSFTFVTRVLDGKGGLTTRKFTVTIAPTATATPTASATPTPTATPITPTATRIAPTATSTPLPVTATVIVCGVFTTFTSATATTLGAVSIAGQILRIESGGTLFGAAKSASGTNLCLVGTVDLATGQLIRGKVTSFPSREGFLGICGTVTSYRGTVPGTAGAMTIGAVAVSISANAQLLGTDIIIGRAYCVQATLNSTGQINNAVLWMI